MRAAPNGRVISEQWKRRPEPGRANVTVDRSGAWWVAEVAACGIRQQHRFTHAG
jgi:hypothetical protein